MKERQCNKKKPFKIPLYTCFIFLIALFLTVTYLYQNSSLFYRRSFTLPLSLHLNKQDLYMIRGENIRLYVFGINLRVSYSSTNFRVAGVNFNGRVYAHQTGKAYIIAKVRGKQLKCRVHVIDMNKENLELKVGDTYKLKVIGTNSFTRWESRDKEIAEVSMFGKVRAKNKGSTVIYAKAKGKILKCNISVK